MFTRMQPSSSRCLNGVRREEHAEKLGAVLAMMVAHLQRNQSDDFFFLKTFGGYCKHYLKSFHNTLIYP